MAQWNPQDYARNSASQEQWAHELFTQLDLRRDDMLLDIGCGDGRHTAQLAAMLPDGSAVGIDCSPEMIDYARHHHGGNERVRFEVADAASLPFVEAFSCIFSNAALHWLKDHRPVLAGIGRALKPGGRALLQMGGRGNGEEIFAVFDAVRARPQWAPYFATFEFPWGFHAPEQYVAWAGEFGLEVEEALLLPKTMCFAGGDGLLGWMRTTCHPYTVPLPEALHARFFDEVREAYLAKFPPDDTGQVRVGMVRLQVRLRKASGG